MQYQELQGALKVHFDEMDLCRRAGTWWALVHIIVCLPDVCAALESDNGETTGDRYQKWCDKYLPNPLLTGAERYDMRCRVLHQGQAGLRKPDRYTGFSFARPSSAAGIRLHGKVENGTLILDVRKLSEETEKAVGAQTWFLDNGMEAHKKMARAQGSNCGSPEGYNHRGCL